MLQIETGLTVPAAPRAENVARKAARDIPSALSPLRREAWGEAVPVAEMPEAAWAALTDRAAEPNAFYEPAWIGAMQAHAAQATPLRLLAAWDGRARSQLLGLLPVVPAWHALKLPVPMLVGWQAYAPLVTPLLAADAAEIAWHGLLDAAAATGAQALLLPGLSTCGPAAQALARVLAQRHLIAHTMTPIARASLDATADADALLREALGAKKLKELRRQRHRLADSGPVTFDIAREPRAAASALETFLALEARGWKARRGTALLQNAGDAAFIRAAVPALAAQGRCQIVTLAHGGVPVAAGIVLRQGQRAFFFKIAIEESEARTSPGVQLTLDLTRALCADPAIREADSTADANHPMIDHVWRGRLAIADLFVPLAPRSRSAALIRNLVALRAAARNGARTCYHALRALTEKRR